MNFDYDLIRQGLTLTAIGMGAAFGLLLLLMAVIQVTGLATGYQSRRASMKVEAAAARTAAESRDKALAAVIAVSALLERDGDSGAGAAA
jgi:sodium pump decarboxylase gamma subunit